MACSIASIYWFVVAEREIDGVAIKARLRRLLRLQQARGSGPWLHAEVARRMAQRLQLIRMRPQHLLEWWGGLGCSDEVLTEAYPNARRTVVEPDDAWLVDTRGRRHSPWWSARRWSGGTQTFQSEDQPLLDQGCQMVWANMVLHGASDPPSLMARWHQALQVEGFLMFSSLGPDSLKELRGVYRRLGWAPPGVEFVDMHDLGDMLVHAGFADPVMDQETLTLTWATPAELLAELRSLGGNVSPGRPAGLRTQRWQDQLEAGLQDLRGPDGRLQLSFEVSYGHAFKPAPRRQAGADTTVSLDQMRELARQPRKLGEDSPGLG